MLRQSIVRVAIFLTMASALWLPVAHAQERDPLVASVMERLIPRSQLQSQGPGDYPTFFRWYVPIRLTILSRDDGARATIEREVVGPLLQEFEATTSLEAALVDYQSDTNVLLIVGGGNPQDDFQFYADKIQAISNDPEVLADLVKDAQSNLVPCHRNWRFVQGAVERAILYTPLPSQDAHLSRKCAAVNFGVLVGLLGKPSSGDTITNTQREDLRFTEGDKAALRVLYDTRMRRQMSMGDIEELVGDILSR